MKLKMLMTRKGCEDGFHVREFEQGREYEIRDSLARAFLAAGFAIKVFEEKPRKEQGKRRVYRRINTKA